MSINEHRDLNKIHNVSDGEKSVEMTLDSGLTGSRGQALWEQSLASLIRGRSLHLFWKITPNFSGAGEMWRRGSNC